jgi:hypothetical protein
MYCVRFTFQFPCSDPTIVDQRSQSKKPTLITAIPQNNYHKQTILRVYDDGKTEKQRYTKQEQRRSIFLRLVAEFR